MIENMDYTGNCSRCVQTQSQLSKSDIFGVLQNDRRRHVLELLRSHGNQSVRSLSEEIARLEAEDGEPNSSVRKSIYISLLQTHIPKMESLGIITYNREHDTVELLPAVHDFDVYMETANKSGNIWSQFYLGLSILAIGGSLTILSGLIECISSSQWMFFVSIIFLVSSTTNMCHFHKLEG